MTLTNSNAHSCSICSGRLEDIQESMSALICDEVGMPSCRETFLNAWCPSCQIYLYRIDRGKDEGNWSPPHIKIENLGGEASHHDYLKVEKRVKKYRGEMEDMVKENWEKFNKMKRDTDRIYKVLEEGKFYGLALKRGDIFIGSFNCFPIGFPDFITKPCPQEFGRDETEYGMYFHIYPKYENHELIEIIKEILGVDKVLEVVEDKTSRYQTLNFTFEKKAICVEVKVTSKESICLSLLSELKYFNKRKLRSMTRLLHKYLNKA